MKPASAIWDVLEKIKMACERSQRAPDSIRLVAVSKGQVPEKIRALLREGQVDFGENYVQEWKQKRALLEGAFSGQALRWHFIGHLQTNKAAEVVGEVDWIHSVDSFRLAGKIARLAERKSLRQKILLEVNLAEEPAKSGFTGHQLLADLPKLSELPHLEIGGLMAIPPVPRRPEDNRPYFRGLKSLLDEINQMGVFRQPLSELSMGMSEDFEIAVEEGATMVRIGTALFGPRS